MVVLMYFWRAWGGASVAVKHTGVMSRTIVLDVVPVTTGRTPLGGQKEQISKQELMVQAKSFTVIVVSTASTSILTEAKMSHDASYPHSALSDSCLLTEKSPGNPHPHHSHQPTVTSELPALLYPSVATI